MVYSHFPPHPPFRRVGNLIWVISVWLFFFYYQNLYNKRFTVWDEMEALVKASFFSTAAVFAIISIGKLGDEVSRTLVVVMRFLAMLIIPLLRVTTKKTFRRLGFLRRKVLIIGATEAGGFDASALRTESNYGYSVVWATLMMTQKGLARAWMASKSTKALIRPFRTSNAQISQIYS
jgi:FlaA1/EpsC-like NDP-sugar epimerase